MPVYNSEKFLREAVDAVLQEEYRDLELLCCDDRSKDGSLAILREYEKMDPRVKVFAREKNSGNPSIVYQYLASQAKGAYLCFSDSDDIALPDRLKTLEAVASRRPDAGVVYGKVKVVWTYNNSVRYYGGQFDAYKLFKGNFIPDGSCLIRKDIFDRIGGYDTSLDWAEDYELRLRLAMEAPCVFIDKEVYVYRIHKKNWTHTNAKPEDEKKFRIRIREKCLEFIRSNDLADPSNSFKAGICLEYNASYLDIYEKRPRESKIVKKLKRLFGRSAKVCKQDIIKGLYALGVKKGMRIVVHSSLNAFGRVDGGARTVVEALKEAVTEQGLIMMPAFTYGTEASGALSDKRCFRPDTPVSKDIGRIAEEFRKSGNVHRNFHPQLSFTFWGKDSDALAKRYRMSDSLSADGPLAEVLTGNGYILMLGTGLSTVSLLHASEYSAGVPYAQHTKEYCYNDGSGPVKARLHTTGHSIKFERLGPVLERSDIASSVRIGDAECKLAIAKKVHDIAANILKSHQGIFLCGKSSCVSCSERSKFLVQEKMQ